MRIKKQSFEKNKHHYNSGNHENIENKNKVIMAGFVKKVSQWFVYFTKVIFKEVEKIAKKN